MAGLGRLISKSGRKFTLVAIAGGVLMAPSGSLAIPDQRRPLAKELKMTAQTVRVKLSGLGRVLKIKGTDLSLSLAKKPELGQVSADQWIIDCGQSLLVDPESGRSRKIPGSGVLLESQSGVISINGRRFREQIVVYPGCQVVNHLNIERYLESVVNNEFNSQWARSAVEAQIIAARSYALYQMNQMRKDPSRVFDVDSTQKDQVYSGLDRVDSMAAQLVLATRGLVLVPEQGGARNPIKAFYHSSCGGKTTLPQKVWGARYPGLNQGSRCPYCAGAPGFEWQHEVTIAEVMDRIEKGLQNDPVHRKNWPKKLLEQWHRYRLTEVRPLNRTDKNLVQKILPSAEAALVHGWGAPDPRVQELQFIFSLAQRSGEAAAEKIVVNMDAYQARNWLDPAQLKSTWFSLKKFGSVLQFRGYGSGHGVGMCQWGSKKMGEKGFSRDQILRHYYPGVKIARLW